VRDFSVRGPNAQSTEQKAVCCPSCAWTTATTAGLWQHHMRQLNRYSQVFMTCYGRCKTVL
jgi:hypothetical protein